MKTRFLAILFLIGSVVLPAAAQPPVDLSVVPAISQETTHPFSSLLNEPTLSVSLSRESGNYLTPSASTNASTTTRVSIASDGTQADGHSRYSSLSANCRYVAFMSGASNLVVPDTNGWADVFVHDHWAGETTRVSIASDSTEGNSSSHRPSISADGRYVAFDSISRNLVEDDNNGQVDVFVHDRWTRETTRVSIASDKIEGNGDSWEPSISADGRYVAFSSLASNLVLCQSSNDG